MKQFNYH